MKLPVAPESKSALTECTSLVSVVLTSIRRMINIPWASRVLMESHLGNLFSHFGFWGCVVLSGSEGGRRDASIGSWISVLTSFMSNTANLLTSSDWGVRLANFKAGIKPTAPLSAFDKENSIEFPLDFLHYLYNYYMVCALFSHACHVTYHVTSCDVTL